MATSSATRRRKNNSYCLTLEEAPIRINQVHNPSLCATTPHWTVAVALNSQYPVTLEQPVTYTVANTVDARLFGAPEMYPCRLQTLLRIRNHPSHFYTSNYLAIN